MEEKNLRKFSLGTPPFIKGRLGGIFCSLKSPLIPLFQRGRAKLYFLAPFVFAFLFFAFINTANAATLYFNPSSGNFTVGNLLTTSVLVNTQEETINNSDATINFPAGLLEVISVSKAGSIFSLWVEEPAFSNSAGTITFNGGLPTPGFNGTAGKIVSIVFRVKSAGSASLIFSSAAVRANDGYGTDILQARADAQFNLTSVGTPPATPPATPVVGTPAAPKVSSETHPDPTKWYANDDPSFSWVLTKDITGVNVLADRNPNSNPGTKSDGMRTSYTFKDVDEGAWYFHIRLKNSVGWGATTHFGFNIDTEAPTALQAYFTDTDQSNTRPTIKLSATDTMSGVDYYEIYANNTTSTWRDDSTGQYQLDTLPAGSHKINITAYDKARNGVSTELFRNVVLPPEALKVVSAVSAWDELYAWLKLNVLWIIIIFLVILLIIILIYNTIYLRKLFAPPKKISRKKWSAYTTRRKIEALQNELQWHAEAIKATGEKRRLRWKERCLRWQYRKLIKRTKKYLDKIPK
mgnify:CR=1 FL=1